MQDSVKTTGAGARVLTVEELVALCVRLQPVEAAQERDSDLCVSPLIDRLRVDGVVVELDLVGGRWAAGYPRVSDEVQRAAASRETRRNGSGRSQDRGDSPRAPMVAADGFSEEEQLTRQIRHFVRHKQAFKIYSDCGVTGEYPIDDPALIRRLLEGKAKRYSKIFERTLLDETSLSRRTPGQVASMRAYLAARVAGILRGIPDGGEGEGGIGAVPPPLPGRPRKGAYFRQGLTQLWRDIAAGKTHTVAVSDRSRLCRAADLETEFLRLIEKHGTRLVGLIEDLSALDVSDPLKKGFTFLLASINEYRLEEIAGHSFRGILQLLESGHPSGKLPWWLERDARGFAVAVPEHMALARRVVDMSMSGLGLKAVVRVLVGERIRLGALTPSASTLAYTLTSDALIGVQHFFGLGWPVYPAVIDAATYTELKRVRGLRDAPLSRLHDRAGWAEHLFTGILFCGVCSVPLTYNQPSAERAAMGDAGYYLCKAEHRTGGVRKGGGSVAPDVSAHHACLSAVKIGAFFDGLISGSPHLLRQALLSGGGRAAQAAAQCALLEESLRTARARHVQCESDARSEATRMVLGMGLCETGAGFAAAVSGICASLTEGEAKDLAGMEGRVRDAEAQSAKETRSSRSLAAVDALGGWATLDAVTRNRLLRALFRVTVHPMPRKNKGEKRGAQATRASSTCGYLDIALAGVDAALAGVDAALAPVWMRRGPGKGVMLPTMDGWLADTLADAAL